jgi:DNA-nicking Smr family endonuclease
MALPTLNKQRTPQSTRPRRSRPNRSHPRRKTSSDKDTLMEQIPEKRRSMPEAEMLKKIASLPGIRRGKVLSICCQLRSGSYPIEDRWDRAIDHALDTILP